MVQIIPRVKNSVERFSEAFSPVAEGLGYMLGKNASEKKQQRMKQQQQQAIKSYGEQLGIGDISQFPESIQKEIFSKAFAEKQQEKNFSNQLQLKQMEWAHDPDKFAAQYGAKAAAQMQLMNQLGLTDISEKDQRTNQPVKQQKGILSPEFESSESSEKTESKGKSQLYPQDQITKMAMVNPAIADKMQKYNDNILAQQRHEENLSFQKEKESNKAKSRLEELNRQDETAISKPILLELNQSRKNIPLQEQAVEDIMNASPDVGIRDYLADVFKVEPLRTSEGVKLRTAVKDFFLSDLQRAGGKPNMFIEQQLADALPKVGRSPEANQITAAGMQFKVDLAKKRIETIDRLAEEDREKYGYVKGDIDSRAYNEMKKYVIDRQAELKKQIEGIKKGKVIPGTKLTTEMAVQLLNEFGGDRKKAEEHARGLGYEF